MSDVLASTKLFALIAATAMASAPSAPPPSGIEWMHLEATTAYLGVPFNVLVAAAVGSLIGVWNTNIVNRRSLTVAFFSSTVLAVTVSTLGPEFTGYRWSSTGIHASAAMLLGFTAQNWGPELISNAGSLARQILRRFVAAKGDQS
ncbi:MAG TPA: hypothetical protein VGC24_05525 [Burkholderiaceae bacterium]